MTVPQKITIAHIQTLLNNMPKIDHSNKEILTRSEIFVL